MKKNHKFYFLIICLIFITGCKQENIYEKDFGTYEVTDGWVESETHSSDSKFFYVLDGTDNDETPNNISINVGTNRYSIEEHEQFKEAILKQLYSQVSSYNATVTASGSTTDNNYIVYTFIIYEKETDVTTTQYYIVGDYKYVLIHETVFDDSKEADEVAKKIVNSFKWKQ